MRLHPVSALLVKAGVRLFLVALVTSTVLPTTAQARRRSCLRGPVQLVAASTSIRVVQVTTKPDRRTTTTRYFGCRVADGRRFQVLRAVDVRDEGGSSARFEIVEDRYIGVFADWSTGVAAGSTAAVWDARRRRRRHAAGRCGTLGDHSGPLEAVFLPRGGMAYACDALYLAEDGGERQLEPPEAHAHDLAVSRGGGYAPLLQWYVGDRVTPGAEQPRSLRLIP